MTDRASSYLSTLSSHDTSLLQIEGKGARLVKSIVGNESPSQSISVFYYRTVLHTYLVTLPISRYVDVLGTRHWHSTQNSYLRNHNLSPQLTNPTYLSGLLLIKY